MRCCKANSKEKRRIIAGTVVLLIILLAASLVVYMFEIRKSPGNKEGRYMIFYM